MDGYNNGYDACSNGRGSRDSSEGGRTSNGGSADTDSGYRVTVRVGEHPFGNEWSYVWIETEDGYTDSETLPTAGDPSANFDIPSGYGDSVKVCASSAIVAPNTCKTFSAGEDISVTLDVEALID